MLAGLFWPVLVASVSNISQNRPSRQGLIANVARTLAQTPHGLIVLLLDMVIIRYKSDWDGTRGSDNQYSTQAGWLQCLPGRSRHRGVELSPEETGVRRTQLTPPGVVGTPC